MKLLLVYFLICIAFTAKSQNLVHNPSFEDWTDLSNFDHTIEKCDHWFYHDNGTPDYINSDIATPALQQVGPRTGNSMIGLGLIRPTWNVDYREYVTGELITPLLAGKEYYVSFWVLLDEDHCLATDDICAYFSQAPPENEGWEWLLDVEPQICNKQNRILYEDTTTWIQVCGTFIAEGQEKYITLGNFATDPETTMVPVKPVCKPETYGVMWVYYFFDDITVLEVTDEFDEVCADTLLDCPAPTELVYAESNEQPDEESEPFNFAELFFKPKFENKCDIIFPNVFTANEDQINDEFVVEINSNDYDFHVVNRWGQLVHIQTEGDEIIWDGEELKKGKEVPAGVYFYHLSDRLNSCYGTGNVHLIK